MCSSPIASVVMDGVNTTALPRVQFQNFTAATKTCYLVVHVVKVVNCQARKMGLEI